MPLSIFILKMDHYVLINIHSLTHILALSISSSFPVHKMSTLMKDLYTKVLVDGADLNTCMV